MTLTSRIRRGQCQELIISLTGLSEREQVKSMKDVVSLDAAGIYVVC